MNQLFTIIASALKLPSSEIDLCTAMKSTAAWDSLAHMDLVISIEEHYQITLDGDQIGRHDVGGSYRRATAAKRSAAQ